MPEVLFFPVTPDERIHGPVDVESSYVFLFQDGRVEVGIPGIVRGILSRSKILHPVNGRKGRSHGNRKVRKYYPWPFLKTGRTEAGRNLEYSSEGDENASMRKK